MPKKKPAPRAKPKAVPKIRVHKQPGTQLYEKRLLKMRGDILRLVQNKRDVDVSAIDVGDEADQASQTSEREILFELSDNERNILDAVEASLRKIGKNTYGICESCRKKIASPRLQAIPHARYCIACQARFDRPKA